MPRRAADRNLWNDFKPLQFATPWENARGEKTRAAGKPTPCFLLDATREQAQFVTVRTQGPSCVGPHRNTPINA